MKHKILYLFTMAIATTFSLKAQLNVGSTGAADPSAILQATSTTKGFLLPVMTTSQRNAIASPAPGLLIFNSTTNQQEVNSGTTGSPVWGANTAITFYNGDGTLAANRIVTQGANTLSYVGSGGIAFKSGTTDFDVNALIGKGDILAGGVIGIGITAQGGLNIGQNNGSNIFIGYNAGKLTTGTGNQFIGMLSGQANTSGGLNTFSGYQAGKANTIGVQNVFTGAYSGFSNVSGNYNTFTGINSGYAGSTGSYNVFNGTSTGSNNTTGSYNLFAGTNSGQANTTGSNNTALGFGANQGSAALTNSTALGANAVATVSNSVVLGNSSVTSIGGYAPYTSISDARFKYNIKANVLGLEFIQKLRPVTYQLDAKKLERFTNDGVLLASFSEDATATTHTGFLAQDVENAANELSISFDGVHVPENVRDHYSLAYAQFVVPLVKAVQEQQAQIDNLTKQNIVLTARLAEIDELKIAMVQLRNEINKTTITRVVQPIAVTIN